MIDTVVTKPAKNPGCSGSGGLPNQGAFDAGLSALEASGAKSDGDGLIHASYDYRITSTSMTFHKSKAVIEAYGWGTVSRIHKPIASSIRPRLSNDAMEGDG